MTICLITVPDCLDDDLEIFFIEPDADLFWENDQYFVVPSRIKYLPLWFPVRKKVLHFLAFSPFPQCRTKFWVLLVYPVLMELGLLQGVVFLKYF
jgi:hypothetical protein